MTIKDIRELDILKYGVIIPPMISELDVEYHVEDCIVDIDIKLKRQFKLFDKLIDVIAENTLTKTLIDTDLEGEIDLSSNNDNQTSETTLASSSSTRNNNNGIKKIYDIDYVELQKVIALSRQTISLSAEIARRKEKINYPYSDLTLFNAVERNELLSSSMRRMRTPAIHLNNSITNNYSMYNRSGKRIINNSRNNNNNNRNLIIDSSAAASSYIKDINKNKSALTNL